MQQLPDLISIGDLSMYLEVDYATAKRWVQKNKYLIIEKPGKGGRGGIKRWIKYDSLPRHEQLKVFYSYYQINGVDEIAGINLAEYPDWQVDQAFKRLAIIERALQYEYEDKDTSGPKKKRLAEENGISARTLNRWIFNYYYNKKTHQEQILALMPKYGKGKGKRYKGVDEEIVDLIQSKYLQLTRPKIQHVYEYLKEYCRENNKIHCPGYHTVRSIIKEIPPAKEIYYRDGKKAWSKTYEPIARRNFDDLFINQYWCGDHRELDVFVYANKEKTIIKRPWVTAWLDLRSRRLVGWCLSFRPNSHTIALALRNGILCCGIPSNVYVDNGKDYRCHYLDGRVKKIGAIGYHKETESILKSLNIQAIPALPYNARAKPIEPFFRNIAWRLEQYIPGWCGRDNKQRPEKLKKELKNGALLHFDELGDQLEKMLDDYNNREHSGIDGQTPMSLWKNVTVERIPARNLDFLLMRKKQVRFWNDGIHMFNGRFRTPELIEKCFVGEKLDVRYDFNDAGRLYVYRGTEFIAEVTREKDYRMGATKEDYAKMGRARKAQLAMIKNVPSLYEKKKPAEVNKLNKTRENKVTDKEPEKASIIKLRTEDEKAIKSKEQYEATKQPEEMKQAVNSEYANLDAEELQLLENHRENMLMKAEAREELEREPRLLFYTDDEIVKKFGPKNKPRKEES